MDPNMLQRSGLGMMNFMPPPPSGLTAGPAAKPKPKAKKAVVKSKPKAKGKKK